MEFLVLNLILDGRLLNQIAEKLVSGKEVNVLNLILDGRLLNPTNHLENVKNMLTVKF